MPYDIADSVPIAWDVKDATGTLANATTATLTITLPDGTTATPSVTNPPTVMGEYRVTYVPTVEGRYSWRAVTTVPNTAYQDVFVVRGADSPSLLSLADAKTHLKIPASDTSSDDELREYLEGSTKAVEDYVGPIVKRTYTRRISGHRRHIPLPHTQVTAITALTLVSDGTSPYNLSDLSVDPTTGVVTFKNYGWFPYGDMNITYTVGRSVVDANWTLAAKMILKHNWAVKLGNLPSVQGDDPGYVVSGNGYLVPFRAMALLQPDDVPVGFA